MAVQGERIPGGFILITSLDGIRYAVRPQSVGIIHDADECRDETMIQLHGGHVIRVPCSLDEVLAWFPWVTPLRARIAVRGFSAGRLQLGRDSGVTFSH